MLHTLHLGVHNARVLTLPVDMVDLGEVVLLPQGGVEDVVHVDWQDVQETRGTCCVDCVAGMISVCPGIGPVCQAPVSQQVQHLFIWIVLASQEDKVLQSVGQAVMVLSFCGQTEVTIDYGRLGLGQDHCKAGQLRSVFLHRQRGGDVE